MSAFSRPLKINLTVLAVTAGMVTTFASAAPPQLPAINQPATNRQLTGKLNWFDLLTDNVEGAKQFYGSVFGWKFTDLPDPQRRYTVISVGNERIGGILQPRQAAIKGSSAHWLTFISVADAEVAARYAKSNGGQVLSGPTSVPARGTHVVFRDPQGALIAVLKSESGDPPDEPVETGEIIWADLFVPKPAEATAFYRGLTGWTSEAQADGGKSERMIMNAGGFSRAGIKPLPAGAKAGWLPYIQVTNVAATLKRVQSAGGKILVPPSREVLNGRVAIIADPQGGVFGIVHWIPTTKKESRQ